MAKQTTILIILDGWGVGMRNDGNPLHNADLQTVKYIEDNFAACALKASGVAVGLPWEEEGSSQVGHLTLGAGRVIYQGFMRINKALKERKLSNNPALLKALKHAQENSSTLHLVGLLSKGHAHSHIEHLKALIKMAQEEKLPKLVLHLFADGIDSSSRSVEALMEEVQMEMPQDESAVLGTITGRYWAMDTDKNWDRIEKAYKAIMGKGEETTLEEAVKSTYSKDLNDEYINPSIINKTPVEDGDSVIFFNFRESGMEELSRAFLDASFNEFPRAQLKNVQFTAMTRYFEDDFNADVAFPPHQVKNTLTETLARAGKTQMTVAESLKWPHVTYHFNGLKYESPENEFRVKIPSDKVGKPEKNPGMMADDITERILVSLQDQSFDFIMANYANADIMAHTGNFNAVMEAAKIIDTQLNRLIRAVLDQNHTLIITSDHGNAELVFDRDKGEMKTDHSDNPVPLYIVGNDYVRQKTSSELKTIGVLSDVAPTILDIMNIEKPEEMNGNSLLPSL